MSSQYQAYLLRLRRNEGQIHWRATLENAHTGELFRFANERELLHHLIQLLAIEAPNPDEQPDMNDTSQGSNLDEVNLD